MGLSRGRREARSLHHGQSLTSRNTVRFFWMHCVASLRICRRRMWVHGGPPAWERGQEDRQTGGQSNGGNRATVSCLFQVIYSTGQQGGGPQHGELFHRHFLWGIPQMGCHGGCTVMLVHPRSTRSKSAGRDSTVPSASYIPGETESPCKPLGRGRCSGTPASLVASPAWKPHRP